MITDHYRGTAEDVVIKAGSSTWDRAPRPPATSDRRSFSPDRSLPAREKAHSGIRMTRSVKELSEFLSAFIFDCCALIMIFLISIFMRKSLLPLIFSGFPSIIADGTDNLWWILAVWLFFLFYEGLYTKSFSFWDEIGALWRAALFSTVGTFAVVSLAKIQEGISRTTIVLAGTMAIAAFPLMRIAFKRTLRNFGLFNRRVLILGAGETGRLVARALKKESNYGYDVMGFLDDDPEKYGKTIDGVKVHRGIGLIGRYIEKCAISDVVIAMPGAGKKRLLWLANNLQYKVDRILFVPDILGVPVLGTDFRHFSHEEAFALELKNNLAVPLNIFVKRTFDIVLGMPLLPVLILPAALIAFIIKMDSKGPAFFRQIRLGKNGKTFACLKFRTMHTDAEKRLSQLLERDPAARREWEQYWKLKDDPRVTRIGRFLRATSLDELPQIINVLKGEMSLIGPRPYLPHEKEAMGDFGRTILLAKPGISGLWQVSGRSTTSYTYRIGIDNWYVRNWNLWFDIVILLKTVGVVIKREGAC